MSAAKEFPFDLLAMILLDLDVEDIIRCKRVCKSWHSFISSPGFVKAHLKHAININIGGGGHRRIMNDEELSYSCNVTYIVGSCNGLVCVSPKGAELEVTNPCTREIRKLQTPRYRYHPDERFPFIRNVLILGFGYDPSSDDYKVVAGFRKEWFDDEPTHCHVTQFYVLALRSNVWKLIGEVNYKNFIQSNGIFCGGALYWFMSSANWLTPSFDIKKVIMCVDLSTYECKEIPQPTDVEYEYERCDEHYLGVIGGCLCIYSYHSGKKRVMKNNKWELYSYNECTYDVLHNFTRLDSQKKSCYGYTIDDGELVPQDDENYIITIGYIYVMSLVSPHPPKVQQLEGNDDAKGNIRKGRRKKKKRSCKHKRVFF